MQEIFRKGNLEFEAHLKEFAGGEKALDCSSEIDASPLALIALGIRSGDEIITTPFTFITTVETKKYTKWVT